MSSTFAWTTILILPMGPRPGNPPGRGNVVYSDGHLVWLEGEAFQREIAK